MTGGKTVFELRVHGVSGTPPEAMLSCPKEFIELVSGDADAGFYRRPEWIDRVDKPPEDGKSWRRMEAYSWGGLTSRKATRAVWLLFLPFSLINLAHWMLPPAARPRPAGLVVVLLRLLALSFTLTLLLAMSVAVLDIAVWQCSSAASCRGGWGPLALIGPLTIGWRLLIGALPLVGVIGVLWWLGREETTRDDQEPAFTMGVAETKLLNNKTPPPGPVVTPKMRSPLTRNTFWNRDESVQCMRACHVTAWTAGLGALVLAAPIREGHPGAVGVINIVLLVVNLGFLGAAVVATASSRATGRGGRPAPSRIQDAVNAGRWIALGLLVVTLLWVARSFTKVSQTGPSSLPGLHTSIYVLVLVQAALLIAVFIGIAMSGVQLSAENGFEPTLKGRTAGFVAVLGWLIGGGLSAAVGLWTAQTLGTWVYSSDAVTITTRAPLIVPPAYVWASVATVVVLVAAAIAVIWLLVKVFQKGALKAIDVIANQGDVENSAPKSVLRRVTLSRRFATLPDRGPSLIASLALIACALVLAAAVMLYLNAATVVDTWVRDGIGGFAVGATVALAVLFFALVGTALRNRNTRRLVAILWDVITFWPRANHPLTPPSYGGRTVFDLRLRMRVLREQIDPTEVILVAHSQGTIIAAATLMQMKDPDEQHPLLTFGSPLRRLYARNFPAYFGRDTLCRLRNSRSWINLWALTDPIGGWAFAHESVYVEIGDPPQTMKDVLSGVDCRVFDVAQVFPKVGAYDVGEDGAVCGHSGFWSRGEYVTAVNLLQMIVAPDSKGLVDATIAPTERAW